MKTYRLAFILAIALLCAACGKVENNNNENPEPEPAVQRDLPDLSELVKKAGIVKELLSSSKLELAEGVEETDLTVTLTTGQKEIIFVVTTDLTNEKLEAKVSISSAIKDIPTGPWPMSTLSYMANLSERKGENVVAMINADFWDTKTLVPRGPVHSEGFVYNSSFSPAWNKQGISFVAYGKDGKMSIDYSSAYTEATYEVPEVTGSGIMLVWGGKHVDNSSWPADDRHPRTAIGYTKDGFLYFFCVDGRNEGVSDGMTYDDMGSILEAFGCERAVNLDGGGSTQLLVKNPSSDKFEIRNKPSDGYERSVVNAWAIILSE